MVADNNEPGAMIPDAGTEKRRARSMRTAVVAISGVVIVGLVAWAVYGMASVGLAAFHKSVGELSNKSSKAQGTVQEAPTRDLAREAAASLRDVSPTIGGAGKGPSTPIDSSALDVAMRAGGLLATVREGESGREISCPDRYHPEIRFAPDGKAVDVCLPGERAVPTTAAVGVKKLDRLDQPLFVEGRGDTNAAGAGGAGQGGTAPSGGKLSERERLLKQVTDANAQMMDKATGVYGQAGAAAATPAKQESGENDPNLEERFSIKPLAGVSATRLGNLSLLWAKGTGVDCALDGRVDTSLAGYVSCTLSDNVYSANGKTLLIPKGSLGFVEYRAVQTPGQHRFDAIVESIRTADGVNIELDSGGMGPLGETGVEGYLDNMWGARLGAALVVALLGDVAQYEEAKVAGSNGGLLVSTSNSQQTIAGMPSQILAQTIKIKPRIIKAQGETIRVVAARDLDFSTVYRLRPTLQPAAHVMLAP